jgi:hypothetical protein
MFQGINIGPMLDNSSLAEIAGFYVLHQPVVRAYPLR